MGKMIEEYITTREPLRLVLILVDFRHEPSQEDVQMREFFRVLQYPISNCDDEM